MSNLCHKENNDSRINEVVGEGIDECKEEHFEDEQRPLVVVEESRMK